MHFFRVLSAVVFGAACAAAAALPQGSGGSESTLLLENRAENTAQNLPHPMDVCDSISFGSADHAFLSPGASARQNIMAVLYPSLADCQARQNRIAVVQANVDTDISVNNHPVDVGAVRITS